MVWNRHAEAHIIDLDRENVGLERSDWGLDLRFETECLALCEAAAFVLPNVFSLLVSLVKSRQYLPRDCSFLCCCPAEPLRAWPYWENRFSCAASRDSLAFWKEAESELPWKQICPSGEKLHSDFPDGIIIQLASWTSSLLGDRTLLPFPVLLPSFSQPPTWLMEQLMRVGHLRSHIY